MIPVQILWRKLFSEEWSFTITSDKNNWTAKSNLVFHNVNHVFVSGIHEDVEQAVSVLCVKIITELLIPYGIETKSHDVDYWINWREFKSLKHPNLDRASYVVINNSQ